MNTILSQTQKRILRLSIFITLIVTFMSCSGTSQKNNPNKFIGRWVEIGPMYREVDRHHITIEKFGDNFTVKSDSREGISTASYNKENDKLVVPGEFGSGTDVIYNYETKTILLWGYECKKEEVNK